MKVKPTKKEMESLNKSRNTIIFVVGLNILAVTSAIYLKTIGIDVNAFRGA
tara:strand:+ start:3261 stop:3413 length:153 start_codon:yes stop_codon:yes gene_type:complete